MKQTTQVTSIVINNCLVTLTDDINIYELAKPYHDGKPLHQASGNTLSA
jgi:hypothetical protein